MCIYIYKHTKRRLSRSRHGRTLQWPCPGPGDPAQASRPGGGTRRRRHAHARTPTTGAQEGLGGGFPPWVAPPHSHGWSSSSSSYHSWPSSSSSPSYMGLILRILFLEPQKHEDGGFITSYF